MKFNVVLVYLILLLYFDPCRQADQVGISAPSVEATLKLPAVAYSTSSVYTQVDIKKIILCSYIVS